MSALAYDKTIYCLYSFNLLNSQEPFCEYGAGSSKL